MSIVQRIKDALLRRYNNYYVIPVAHRQFEDVRILDSIDSIKYIIQHRCSVSRFGDGEIIMLFGGGYSGYQGADEKLAMRLRQVLLAEDGTNHVIGLPFPLQYTSTLRPSSKEFWDYFTMRYGKRLNELVLKNRIYVDTQLSRFYIIYKDKSKCKEQFLLLREIWNNRDVVIVEGKQSRTGVGNDLYDNAKNLQRIIGYSTDAFSHYDQMLDAITQTVGKDQLILLSYGPTATILAYDLAKLGYQAIDIGHLDIEYEWFRQGAIDNVAIKGKFTNEAQGGRVVDDCDDAAYKAQIVCDITLA